MAARRTLKLMTLLVAAIAVTLGVVSCDEKAGAAVEPVRIAGEWFHLEVAADDATRFKGLGGRDYIAPDGGMLFVFPSPQVRAFVMRDCLVPIDIAYLDAAGRVVAMHEMHIEELRRPGESDYDYESRLKQYSSRFPAQFVVETAGGRLNEVGLKIGDRVGVNVRELRQLLR